MSTILKYLWLRYIPNLIFDSEV